MIRIPARRNDFGRRNGMKPAQLPSKLQHEIENFLHPLYPENEVEGIRLLLFLWRLLLMSLATESELKLLHHPQ